MLISGVSFAKEIIGHGGPNTKTGILYRDFVSQDAQPGDTATLKDGTKVTYDAATIDQFKREYKRIRDEIQSHADEIHNAFEMSIANLGLKRPAKGGKAFPIDETYLDTLSNAGVMNFVADGYDYTQIILVTTSDADRMIRFKKEFTQPPFDWTLVADGSPTTSLFMKGIDEEHLFTYSFTESFTSIIKYLDTVKELTAPVNELSILADPEFERLRIKYEKVDDASSYKINIYNPNERVDGKEKLMVSYTTTAIAYLTYDVAPGYYNVEVIPLNGKTQIESKRMYKAVTLKSRQEPFAQGIGYGLFIGSDIGIKAYWDNWSIGASLIVGDTIDDTTYLGYTINLGYNFYKGHFSFGPVVGYGQLPDSPRLQARSATLGLKK